MTTTLQQFARECHDILKQDPGPAGRRKICTRLEALLRDRAQLGRATRYAAISCAMSLGCIVGELTWHRYRKTACCDSPVLLIAEKSIEIVAPENAIYSLT